MENFVKKYFKLLLVLNLVFVLSIGVSVFSIYGNIRDINILKPYLEEYGNTDDKDSGKDEQKATAEAHKPTVDPQVTALENEVKEKQKTLDRVKTIQEDLSALTEDFITTMKNFPSRKFDEEYVQNLKPFATEECYENYLKPMCEYTSTLPIINTVLRTGYCDLDTQSPKVLAYCNAHEIFNYATDNLYIFEFIPDDSSKYGYLISKLDVNTGETRNTLYFNLYDLEKKNR